MHFTPTVWFVLLVMIGVPLVWEFYTVAFGLQTISEAWAMLGREWNPFFAYAASVLCGHWFISPPARITAAQYVGELGEAFFVVWIGWAVFWGFRANPQVLPLSWECMFALCVASILIGGFAWTIGA